MNKDELLIEYSKSKDLTEIQLDFLEEVLTISMNEARLSAAKPPIATNEICDAIGICHESFEMTCIASILDQLRPAKNKMSRMQQVFHLLLQCSFLYY